MRSVLVVDDSATIRFALARALRALRGPSVEVHEAEDPTRALKVFRDLRPDVVFLDMVFPDDGGATQPDREKEEAGLQVLKDMLRERPDVPIVLVTGLPTNHPDVVDAVNLGATASLRKPLKIEEVRAVLELVDPDDDRTDYIM